MSPQENLPPLRIVLEWRNQVDRSLAHHIWHEPESSRLEAQSIKGCFGHTINAARIQYGLTLPCMVKN
jgi:hypothetical protein